VSDFPVVLVPPTEDRVLALVGDMSGVGYSYADDLVGGTWAETLPEGWFGDDTEEVIGTGEVAFQRGVAALHRWVQFDLGWVTPLSTTVPVVEGQLFAFTSRQVAVWTVNVCRIVRVVDERDGPVRRFGFSYGTLEKHSVRGEERFLLTHDARTDEVRFGIRKFSMPAHWLLWVTLPLVRATQERFTREAIARMSREVQ